MLGRKSLALGIVVLAAVSTQARGDAISGGAGEWSTWFGSGGSFSAASLAPPTPAPAPSISPAPAPVSAPSPAPAPAPTSASTSSPSGADAFLNFGGGPYPNESLITTGNAQPWYNSPQVAAVYGGTPTAQQQTDFANTVLQRVEQTFQQSGVNVNLTTNPSVPTAHTLSIVSGTSSASMPNAIGMTEIGGSGFTFVDPIAKSSQSVDQLQWITAHNLSHELMLAFGVGENYDKSGNYIDAPNASGAMMLDPNAKFSDAAAQAINSQLAHDQSTTGTSEFSGQTLDPQAVPEPATVLVWTAGVVVFGLQARRRLARAVPVGL